MTGCSEKTAYLRNKLQEEEREHNRLLELIQRLKADLEAALADLERLRRDGEPEKRWAQQSACARPIAAVLPPCPDAHLRHAPCHYGALVSIGY